MPQTTNTITINASPDEVWLALVDFPSWSSWNPFLQDVEGVALPGERVKVTVNPNYASLNLRMREIDSENMMSDAIVLNKSSRYKPTITDYQTGKKLSWLHRVWLMFSYRQTFTLEKDEQGATLFTNVVEMKGPLVNMGWELAIKPTYDGGMQLMNEALKLKVESGGTAFDDGLYEMRK